MFGRIGEWLSGSILTRTVEWLQSMDARNRFCEAVLCGWGMDSVPEIAEFTIRNLADKPETPLTLDRLALAHSCLGNYAAALEITRRKGELMDRLPPLQWGQLNIQEPVKLTTGRPARIKAVHRFRFHAAMGLVQSAIWLTSAQPGEQPPSEARDHLRKAIRIDPHGYGGSLRALLLLLRWLADGDHLHVSREFRLKGFPYAFCQLFFVLPAARIPDSCHLIAHIAQIQGHYRTSVWAQDVERELLDNGKVFMREPIPLPPHEPASSRSRKCASAAREIHRLRSHVETSLAKSSNPFESEDFWSGAPRSEAADTWIALWRALNCTAPSSEANS
ncbi:MAG: hypothetical protein JST40_00865 [Armatimonadetes bacterium]|nr:hypothetical protein [Armatimonadota bacterium]